MVSRKQVKNVSRRDSVSNAAALPGMMGTEK